MNIPANLMYAKSHEWVEFLTETTCRVGISDYAQHAMGDIVFVNLPAAGDEATAGEALCDLESVKAVADVYSPVSGTIAEVNGELDDQPELLNTAPYGAWIAEIHNVTGRDGLMDAEAYRAHCQAEEHA
ncbi:glycine cleavage system protein GcvH [Bacillota bacterium Meth-B3]|nr:glycine cleavage system protein GcvH [Christensenellaceae bacterium]MEA5064949.1 glycine cleavage system protein GcvH [Eubacteriales bacterium]